MAVITISRQLAAGGSDVAKALSRLSSWPVIDHEFVVRVASRVGLSTDQVERMDERVPTLIERLAQNLALSSPGLFGVGTPISTPTLPKEDVLEMTRVVIEEAVNEGNVIVVGRGAQAYLGRTSDALHAFVAAPIEARVARLQERKDLSAEAARKLLEDSDDDRRDYMRKNYQVTWGHPSNYDISLNTSTLPPDQSADMIAHAARLRGLLPTP